MAVILMKGIEFLTKIGIKVVEKDVKVTLETNLISIMGDIVALNRMTETLNSIS